LNSNYQTKTLGPLQVIEKKGDKDGLWIILFHGYGADFTDLASLAEVIAAPPGTNWLFPQGPLKIPIGPHNFGRAWFNIDMAAIERAMQTGQHRDMSGGVPEGLDDARLLVEGMVGALGVPLDRVVLGGFSQGAMIAADFSLHQKIGPKAMVLLSGNLLNREGWSALAKRKKGLRYFQSHGINDPILGYNLATSLHSVLTEAGLIGKFSTFVGGHEIPQSVITEVGRFLISLDK
jgi:phospholipase/carboxylesterase